MENKKLTEISNEELVKNEKKMKALIIVFSVVLLIAFITIILSMMKKGFTGLVATPIALLPILIISIKNWNDLKKEIKTRNL